MCDFFAFRDQARAKFPRLNVSVLMFEKGTARGAEVPMYRVKVSGPGLADAVSSQGSSPAEVLASVARQVGTARRAYEKEKQEARARRAAMQGLTTGSAPAQAQPETQQPSYRMAA